MKLFFLLQATSHALQVQQGTGAGEAQAADAPLPSGRLLTYADITPTLKGRQAEVNKLHPQKFSRLSAADANLTC